MNLGWLPLIGLMVPVVNPVVQQGVSQAGVRAAVTLPRIAIEDSSQIEVSRVRG